MIDQNILQQNIISALNLQALDDQKKIDLLDKMSEVIQKRLILRVLKEMDGENKKEFEKVLDSSPDKVADFLQKVFPGFPKMVEEEIAKLKQELIEQFGEKDLST